MTRKHVITAVLLLFALSMGASTVQMSPATQDSSVLYLPLIVRNIFEPLIAFTTNRDGNFEIYALNPRSMTMWNLSRHGADDMAPAWGPHGLLAWASRRDGNWEIYTSDLFGSNPARRITFHANTDFDPTWSPDARRIAFSSDRSGNMDIWAMNGDGTGLVQLTSEPTQQRQPAWSPDGRKIAYTSDQDGKDKLYLMNADGSNKQRLTEILPTEQFPAWSPDSRWVIFTTDLEGEYELYAMAVEQGTLQQATSDGDTQDSFNAEASWSGDGQRVVFRALRESNTDLYLIDFDGIGLGTGLRRLTTSPAIDSQPAWSR